MLSKMGLSLLFEVLLICISSSRVFVLYFPYVFVLLDCSYL